ncbi:Outer membrane protein TolC [Parapedobacter composti]|uniref:Outer membrane protein TolC n=1 Tax=Parapedobacter composti TaxID=623281 RepID=A0A1I1GFE3_9SPHI|nr:TolC family protein [Parapedobacter composti]SFC07880.1 Outer membrane protein TolC [Parapedobacter composti]
MKIRLFLAALVTGILSINALSAQEVLTLKDALNYALNNSEALRKARLEIEGGRHKVAEVRASALPQIDAVSTLTNNLLVQQFVLPAEFMGGTPGEFVAIEAGQTWNAMSQVQLNQQIFNQQVFTGLKAAKSSEEYYRLAAQLAEENLIQQVATNYYQVIITRQQLNVVKANIERVSQLEKTTENQFNLGLAKKIDLDRIRVNKGNLRAQYEQLEYAVTQQENLLKYYMGMPIAQPIVIPETEVNKLESEAVVSLANGTFNVEQLVDYQVLKRQEDLLGLQRKSYVAEYYPTLSISGNYLYNSQSNRFNLYSPRALNYDMSAVTLNLRIPIFDGNARRSRIRQADVELQKIHEDLRNTSNALTMAYENAKIQIKNSLNTIESQRANKEFAEEVFKSTQNNYQNGLASLTDLLTAETDLVAAQNSYNEALLNYKVAQIELVKSNGQIKSLVNE